MSTFPVVSIVHLVTANSQAREIVSEGFEEPEHRNRCPPGLLLLICEISGAKPDP